MPGSLLDSLPPPVAILRLAAAFTAAGLLVAASGAQAAGRRLPAVASTWRTAGLVRAPGGPYLIDAQGRRLQLHGVDLVAKCGGGATPARAAGTPCVGSPRGSQPAFVLSPTARDPGRRFTAADAATLARLGFDFVRLGIIWQGLEPGPPNARPNDPRYCSAHAAGHPFPRLGAADPYNGRVVRAYLAATDRIASLLAAAGLRVVVDMHQDAYGSAFYDRAGPTPWNGEGAPPWATCTGHARFSAPRYWGHAYGDSAVQVAIHHFFANDVRGDLQGQFDRVWAAVAHHYHHNRDVIGYELYNEPSDPSARRFDPELQCFYGGPDREPASCADSGAQAPLGGAIGSIQAADHRHVVVYEPSVASGSGHPETIGIAEPLRFARLVLAFHAYSHQQAALLRSFAQQRALTRTEQVNGPPLLMDEFGGDRHAGPAGATADLADHLELSWSYWSALQDHDPTGNPLEALLDQRTRRPYVAKATALAVAYPAATAGRPGPWSFVRATGAFAYRYSVGRPGLTPTEIELPRYVYPRGYRVTVRGATVVSAANASVLELRAWGHAPMVAVSVRRRHG